MRKLSFALLCVFCAWVLHGCDSNTNAGGSGGAGSAALSLQLEELPAGENYVSGDGVLLNFSAFALAFSKITLAGEEVVEDFAADFFDEEVIDAVVLEDVPAGEYEGVELTLGTASGLSGAVALAAQITKTAAVGGEVTSSLNDHSVLIVGQGINGGATCNLRIELVSDAVLDVHGHEDVHVDVASGEEAEILTVVSPNILFEGISLAPLCTDGAEVAISASSNASLGAAILEKLAHEAVELGSTEGHTHSH